MNWAELFINPPVKNRIKPFWFWNDLISEEEIIRQLVEMKNKGLGGSFICARQGLKIPYLSKEWFEKVKFACDKSKELGLEVWLYDEYPYPSGMSGGEVLLQNPDDEHTVLDHKKIILEEGEDFEINLGWSDVLFAKAFPIKHDKIIFEEGVSLMGNIGNLQVDELFQATGLTQYTNKRFFTYNPQKILKGKLGKGKWQIEIYIQLPLGDFKYYGNFFDPCSKKAVKTFLETTHNKYRDYMSGDFGNKISGMFSDEVGLLSPIPWSKYLPEYFKKLKGYDLLEHLPAIYNSTYENAYSIRYDLYDAIHKLFVESYHMQVYNWCKENNLEYATEVPSMRMSTQKYSSIVGGDTAHEKLGRPTEWIYDRYISKYRSNEKAISSLTRQLGNKYAMIESFHSVGWSMTLQDAKWMFDRLASNGINFYNVHAFYYTINSLTKHDAPPSQFFQNPYWKNYRLLADYAGRLSTFITNTEAEIKIAILDPVATLWAYLGEPFGAFQYKGENESEKEKCDFTRDSWVKVCKMFLFEQLEYDHLDTEILEEAKITDNFINIGRAKYEILVIPPTEFLEQKAYEKILEFATKGGNILFLGNKPNKIIDKNCLKINWDNLFEKSKENCILVENIDDGQWQAWCKRKLNQIIEIKTEKHVRKDIVSSIRSSKGNIFVFLANQGDKENTVSISSKSSKFNAIDELFLENGNTRPVQFSSITKVLLGAYESKLFCFYNSDDKFVDLKKDVSEFIISTKEPMAVEIEGKNIYRLEAFEISKDTNNWTNIEPKTFIEQSIDSNLLEQNDFKYESVFGTPKSMSIKYPKKIYYRTHFITNLEIKELGLLMDKGAIRGDFNFSINNRVIDSLEYKSKFVNDQSNIIYDISDYIKVGYNEIVFEIDITKDSDGIVDPLYLYGDFGVEIDDEKQILIDLPKKAKFDLNYIKGFPYYSGTFNFKTSLNIEKTSVINNIELDFKDSCHECIEICINGVSLGTRAFAPYKWKCNEEVLKLGENEVKISLTNTLANMLDGTWFDYENHKIIKI